MKNILTYAAFIIIIIGLFYIYRIEKQKSARLFENIDSMIQENKHSMDSLIISNKVLVYQVGEVKRLYPELKQQLKEYDIRLNDVQQYQKTILNINAKFDAKLSQKNDTTLISKYTDRFLEYLSLINMQDSSETVQLKMPARLDQVVYDKIKPGFWNHIFRRKELTQKIWTDNPYVELEYNELIQIK